jgi:hypothetical protein
VIQPNNQPLKELFAYWLEKKGSRFAPSRADLDPVDIPRLLPYVGLVDVLRDPLRFRYRLTGSNITTGYGQELTGRFLDEIDLDGHQHEIIREYQVVSELGEAVCATWEYSRKDGRYIAYERLALPLSNDGKTVNMLFGGCCFEKAFG